MPEPGFQNSMPYLVAALSKKSNTSLFDMRDFYANRQRSEGWRVKGRKETSKSDLAPVDAWMRWSQWMLTGTAHRERPALMNCNLQSMDT
jgi:hypothetical protein